MKRKIIVIGILFFLMLSNISSFSLKGDYITNLNQVNKDKNLTSISSTNMSNIINKIKQNKVYNLSDSQSSIPDYFGFELYTIRGKISAPFENDTIIAFNAIDVSAKAFFFILFKIEIANKIKIPIPVFYMLKNRLQNEYCWIEKDTYEHIHIKMTNDYVIVFAYNSEIIYVE